MLIVCACMLRNKSRSREGVLPTPGITVEMDQKDNYVGDEAQSKRRKCSLIDELDIIPEFIEWLGGAGGCVYACKFRLCLYREKEERRSRREREEMKKKTQR